MAHTNCLESFLLSFLESVGEFLRRFILGARKYGLAFYAYLLFAEMTLATPKSFHELLVEALSDVVGHAGKEEIVPPARPAKLKVPRGFPPDDFHSRLEAAIGKKG